MSVIDEEQARRDKLDAAHWAAVEGPTEVLLEGRLEEGLKQLQAVITADPSNPYAYQFLGAAMFDLKQFGPARDAYRAAVKLSPGYRAARVGLAHCLRLLGDLPEAIEQVSQVLAENDEDADALYALGLTLAAGGQLEQLLSFGQHASR